MRALLAAVLLYTAPASAADFVRSGLEWHLVPDPIVDEERVAAQIDAGCTATGPVAFGDTAAMRGRLPSLTWPPEVRASTAASALADDAAVADRFLRDALDVPGLDEVQRAVLANRRILTALQFDDTARARALLSELPENANLPPALRADRALWTVIAAATSDPSIWRDQWMPLLDEGLVLDPTSFGLRTWRVIAWLEAEAWTAEDGCAPRIRALSDRVLDLSAAGGCPVMIGQMARALDLHFGAEAPIEGAGAASVWRRFATGLLATVSGERATARAVTASLATSPLICAPDMARALARLDRLP